MAIARVHIPITFVNLFSVQTEQIVRPHYRWCDKAEKKEEKKETHIRKNYSGTSCSRAYLFIGKP